MQDKKHIREMLKLVSKVIPQRSLLIFDTGANSKDNKSISRSGVTTTSLLNPKKWVPTENTL